MQKDSLIGSAKGYLSISSSGQKIKPVVQSVWTFPTSSSESVTPQTSVHFKCALLYVNEMHFTADRRSIRRYPLEKDLYICKKIRVVWDARAYGLRIFICEEPWGAR